MIFLRQTNKLKEYQYRGGGTKMKRIDKDMILIAVLITVIMGLLVWAFSQVKPLDIKTNRDICIERGGVYTNGTIIFPEKCELLK